MGAGPAASRAAHPHTVPPPPKPRAGRVGGNPGRVKALATAPWGSLLPRRAQRPRKKGNSTFTQGNTKKQKCSRLRSPDFMIACGPGWVTAYKLSGGISEREGRGTDV